MKDKNEVLARLMGWKEGTGIDKEKCWLSPIGQQYSYHPDYDTDLNAMREVWVVLFKQGLFSEFLWKACGFEAEEPGELLAADIYLFLEDLRYQVDTAIEVLKKE